MKHLITAIAFFIHFVPALALADEIKLDWGAVELGQFEQVTAVDEILYGLSVYVPSNRIASKEDFYSILPEFCDSRLEGFLNDYSQIAGVPPITLLRLQIEYYGPKLGVAETYVARAATMQLADGECPTE